MRLDLVEASGVHSVTRIAVYVVLVVANALIAYVYTQWVLWKSLAIVSLVYGFNVEWAMTVNPDPLEHVEDLERLYNTAWRQVAIVFETLYQSYYWWLLAATYSSSILVLHPIVSGIRVQLPELFYRFRLSLPRFVLTVLLQLLLYQLPFTLAPSAAFTAVLSWAGLGDFAFTTLQSLLPMFFHTLVGGSAYAMVYLVTGRIDYSLFSSFTAILLYMIPTPWSTWLTYAPLIAATLVFTWFSLRRRWHTCC